ncbi:MAG TPA: addiction module protein [Chthoniobacter sp.]|nr:addiction module protein [Chthoniobacter sp.]
MIADQIPAVKQLSLQDKWLLANELWAEIEERQQELPTSPEIMSMVEQRFAEFERDPSTAMSLEEFKRRFNLP